MMQSCRRCFEVGEREEQKWSQFMMMLAYYSVAPLFVYRVWKGVWAMGTCCGSFMVVWTMYVSDVYEIMTMCRVCCVDVYVLDKKKQKWTY